MISARVWHENGAWEWDVRDDRPPAQRSTGRVLTWRVAMAAAAEDLAHFMSRHGQDEAAPVGG